MYKDVLERLLLTLAEEEDILKQKALANLVSNEETAHYWPPWPWPPWGDDDDGDDGEKDPINQTERAHKLAKKVLKFESQLANASLDL